MLRQKENELFEEWKKAIEGSHDATFVTDGVVNEDVWNTSELKVLYLLKEVYGGDEEWDERDYLANYNSDIRYKKTHSQTIDILTKWHYGIMETSERTWSDVESNALKDDIQSTLLSQICLVNIKKLAGGSVVDWNKFDLYFNSHINREFINKQLQLYTPDIVICGNTAWHLCQIKGWDYDEWSVTTRGIRYYKEDSTIYIDFCHPNNRGPKNMIFYALMDALKEIRGI